MRSRNLIDSFRHAFAGLGHALRTQRNTRIHLTIAVAVIILGLYLELTATEWAILALTIGMVLVSEMLNTLAETIVDLISPGYHPLAKVIKDVTAGAVLLTAIFSVAVGLLVLGPPLWERLFGG
ncbi:MAG: diacylglycerol kinase family protein [Anaerolineae bacterium]|jgi:diacylglycerol kinase